MNTSIQAQAVQTKAFKVKPNASGDSAYPLRVVDIGGSFQIVPAYAFKGDKRWFQDYVCELPFRELAEFVCTAMNQAEISSAAPKTLTALKNLVANQEEGWRSTGTMPEEHIQNMPYLREARAAIAEEEGRA